MTKVAMNLRPVTLPTVAGRGMPIAKKIRKTVRDA